jgi:hypothetical protein
MATERDSDAAWEVGATSPRKGRRLPLLIGIGIAAALLLSTTCVGGLVMLGVFGLGIVTSHVEAALRGNERLRRHVGEVRDFELDWSKSFAEPGEDTFVYRVQGSRGSGLVRAESLTVEDTEQVVWAELVLPSGEVIELVARED